MHFFSLCYLGFVSSQICSDISFSNVDFLPSTDSNLEFKFACGNTTTSKNADSTAVNLRDKNCRIKCSNWDTKNGTQPSKFWILAEAKPWRKAMYLSCKCDDGNCAYTHPRYDTSQGVTVSCDEPSCTHPAYLG